MKKIITVIIALVVLSAIGGGVYYYYLRAKPTEYFWRTVRVEKGDIDLMVTATGSMAADTSVDVGVQVSGIVAKVKVDFNDKVRKGQVIAILDTTLFVAAKVDASAAVHRAQTAMEGAKITFDRAAGLLNQGLVAKADFDLASTDYKIAEGNLISAKAQLSKALINLKYCIVTAPMSGMIISRNVQVGNMVIASFNSPVLFTIAYDLKKMQVQAYVDEADIGVIKRNQRVKFTVDAYPNDVFEGKVVQIRHQPVMVTSVVNYIVIIEAPNPDLKLMPGLTANANIFIQERKEVFKVPSNAFTFVPPLEYIQIAPLLADSTRNFWIEKLRKAAEVKKQQIVETNLTVGYIWVVKAKDVYPVLVTRGLNDGSFTEISGNITAGDYVATGINKAASSSEEQPAKSPFMPKFPTKKK